MNPIHDISVPLLLRMLSVASPSGGESALADLVRTEGAKLGLEAHVDAVGNVVLETGTGRGPVICLLSHLDTAGGPLPVRLDGDRIHGRGAVDAKGPLAAMICAAASQRDFPGRLIVAGVIEEETPGSRGANHLVATMLRPDALVVGEPSGWSEVVLGYKGQLSLSYTVRRPATHPTNPNEKATEAAAAFWHAVRELTTNAEPGASDFDRVTATLLDLRGTMTEATLAIDARTPLRFDTASFLARLEERSRGGAIDVLGSIDAVRVGRNDPVVRALSAGIRAEGGTPRHKVKTATSDMNTVAPHWPVPMATYGPGNSALDHADDEHLLVGDLMHGIAVLSQATRDLASELAKSKT